MARFPLLISVSPNTCKGKIKGFGDPCVKQYTFGVCIRTLTVASTVGDDGSRQVASDAASSLGPLTYMAV